MARDGCCGYQAAELIGYSSKQGLDYAMAKRGIDITFRKVKVPGKSDRSLRYHKARLAKAQVPLRTQQPTKAVEHPWRRLNREIRRNKE